jgi:hypothetical protein
VAHALCCGTAHGFSPHEPFAIPERTAPCAGRSLRPEGPFSSTTPASQSSSSTRGSSSRRACRPTIRRRRINDFRRCLRRVAPTDSQ